MTTSRNARRRFTLDDLFQDTSPRGEGVTDLEAAKEIRLDRITPDPDQPRRTMDQTRFEELVASVRQEGVLVPIEVSYDAERNVYVIVHGERRFRAATAAGLSTIPALVREVSGQQRIVHQLMENILREDLNAVDRARALRTLKEAMGGVAWELVADAVGIRRSRLFQLLDVIKLPDDLQEDIRAGRLSEKHGRAFKDLPPPRQAELRELVLEEHLSGDETMRVAKTLRRGPVEQTVQEAFVAVRTPPPTAVAAPETAPAKESPAGAGVPQERSGVPAGATTAEATVPQHGPAPSAHAGLDLQAGSTASEVVAASWERGRLARPDAPSTLTELEHSRQALQTALPGLAKLSVEERAQATALLRELRQIVEASLAQLRG